MQERAEQDPLIGRRIAGKYEVQSVIGRGAMGIVYQAKQVALDKIVALKVLSDQLRDDAEFVRRFHTEARAASRLDHPNSTRVLDFGEDGSGLLYIAMELLDGRTLEYVIHDESPLPTERIASIMSQALSAVGAAHKLGILHRDLKPDNIVILAGRDEDDRPIDIVKVCDFGIAKLDGVVETRQTFSGDPAEKSSPAGATRAGHIVGTPEFMSPEQASGQPGAVDTRSDLYSLGCVMYEMLTGKPPFESTSTAMVLSMHMLDKPKPPSTICECDPRLEAICLRSLQKSKDDRYSSAKEMRAELRPLLGNAETVAPVALEQTTGPQRAVRLDVTAPTIPDLVPPQQRRSRVWVFALLLLVVGGGTYAGWRLRKPTVAVAPPVIETTSAASTLSSAIATATPSQRPAGTTEPPIVTTSATVARTSTTGGPIRTARPTSTTVDTGPTETVTAPPPASTPTVVATVPATTSTPTTTVPTIAIDPAHAHADIVKIQPDRINVSSVESGLRHIDFTSCYRTALSQTKAPIQGTGTLEIEMDEERMLRAALTGGDFPSSLRQCISAKAMGAHVPNVDTGSASAKVTLSFVPK